VRSMMCNIVRLNYDDMQMKICAAQSLSIYRVLFANKPQEIIDLSIALCAGLHDSARRRANHEKTRAAEWR